MNHRPQLEQHRHLPRLTVRPRPTLGILSCLAIVATALILAASQNARAAGCADPYPAQRDPANPLMLATVPPPSDPLRGANLFVDGPAHGQAAKAIESLLGINPAGYSDSYSWDRFARTLQSGPSARKLGTDASLRFKVRMLEKIASREEPERFSLYSGGGGPGAIYGQVQKIFCHYLQADPGAIPVISTYFLYQHGYCETASQIRGARPVFERQVRELAQGIGNRPAILLLELDAIGSSQCMAHDGALAEWEADIRYEIGQAASLPHVVAYIEAGYSDAETPAYTAQVLKAVGVGRIRGFFTNDTHNAWTIDEIHWGQQIIRRVHGTHFIVNTATNGRGPKLNPGGVGGIEDLCNAPGRGLGPAPTTNPGWRGVDALLWSGEPGNSSGSCRGGSPSGTFWPARAIGLASRANGKLGAGYPNRPY